MVFYTQSTIAVISGRNSAKQPTSRLQYCAAQPTATSTVQCNTTHCTTVQCNTTHCTTVPLVQHNPLQLVQSVQYSPLHCSTVQHNPLHYSTVQHNPRRHYSTVQHNPLYYSTVQHNPLHYSTVQHNPLQLVQSVQNTTHCTTVVTVQQ